MEGRMGAARALTDDALLESMRAEDPAAWSEFMSRFRPLLEGYARRIGVASDDLTTRVMDVLTDEALRLTAPAALRPRSLSAYLCRALYHSHLKAKRSLMRRERHVAAASVAGETGVVATLCSEYAMDSSRGLALVREPPAESPVRTLARLVAGELTVDEAQLLTWAAELVPRRTIAEWLGISPEAAKKRVARLAMRVKRLAIQLSEGMSDADRAYVERYLARVRGAANPGRRSDQ